MKKRILIADDHPIFREGMVKILGSSENLEVSFQASNGTDAFNFIREHSPDAAILDLSIPGLTGIEIARQINRLGIKTRIIILTMHDDREYFEEAMKSGCSGYLLKDESALEILAALERVLAGKTYVSQSLSGQFLPGQLTGRQDSDTLLKLLTPAELLVLKLLSMNKTSTEISDILFLSFRTVQNHRQNICKKLGITGHNKLLEFAISNKNRLNK